MDTGSQDGSRPKGNVRKHITALEAVNVENVACSTTSSGHVSAKAMRRVSHLTWHSCLTCW